MSTRAVSDRWRLGWLLARHTGRRARTLVTAPLRALTRAPGGSPERLVIAPQDLRTTDPTVANDIYAGYFAFAGKIAATGGVSPFKIHPPSEAWAEALMGFGWLRHLRAADSALARANARALVDDWINEAGKPQSGLAWDVAVVARRMISWLTQSPLILDGADRAFYRRFLRSIGRQTVWLAGALRDLPPSEARLSAALALAYVAICTGAPAGQARRAGRLLSEELDRQILRDGGHVGRNPQTLVDLITDLLPLRQAFASQGLEAPRALVGAIDRMMPALRLFRHGDGALALFNGMSVTPPDRLATLLAYTDARSQPIENAPYSGYQRLAARSLAVIMDAGPPPPPGYSSRAHAGCLSFELSDGPARIVVNCGAPPPGADGWRSMARSTAAHSTLTLADTSSCRFLEPEDGLSAILGTPILAGPDEVTMVREMTREGPDPGIGILASHDGYRAAFGVVHRRRIVLNSQGRSLVGEDSVIPVVASRSQATSDAYALRFHLHPSVRAARAPGGLSVRLDLPTGVTWTFSAGGRPIQIEESIFFATPEGARHTSQLVVTGAYRTDPSVSWRFERDGAAPAGDAVPDMG